MTTLIIGGGVTGLSAGYHLKDDIIILEKEDSIGGLCSSYHIAGEGSDYYIESLYHHLFERNDELLGMCREFGLPVEWRNGTVGYSFDGIVYPLNSPVDILRYPQLSLIEKARLAAFTMKCKRSDPRKCASETAVDFILRNAGQRVYDKFFLPLLRGKFGDDYHDVSAAWLITRVQLRSNRGMNGEKLGYIEGGFHRLTDALAEKIADRGGRIITGVEAGDIVVRNGRVESVATKDGPVRADNVICTVPSLMKKYYDTNVYFQKTVCTLFSLKKKISDMYWVNIGDDLAFKALIEHTNYIPFERYGEHLLYAVVYSSHPLDPERILAGFKADLKRYGISDEDINWQRTFYGTDTAPMYNRSYRYVPYETPVSGLYLAGLFSRPNQTGRTVNGALIAGREVAQIINERQAKGPEQ